MKETLTKGFMGTILEVDLTNGSVDKHPVTRDLAEQFIGGQGIGAYLLYKHIAPDTDPLGPGNALIFNVGPLVNTTVPSGSRISIMAKSPLSGLMGMSNGGGLHQLKLAGYDHLVVKGQATHPVYLKITDEHVELCDARHLWGQDTFDTVDTLRSEIGQEYSVACIGPSGENLVRIACIIGDKYVAWGRTGLGAVMGSKNLKAVAVRGTKAVQAANPARLLGLTKKSMKAITADTEALDVWRTGGTWKWQMGFKDKMAKQHGDSEVYNEAKYDEKIEHRPLSCMGCPVGCKHALKVKSGFNHAGLSFSMGCTSGTMCGPYGSGLGVVDYADVAKCAEQVQRLGMDSITTAGIISWMIELYEAGIIDGQDTQGVELTWSDPDLIIKIMHMIANREGFGHMLAEGMESASKAIGRGSEQYAWHHKGLARAKSNRTSDLRAEISTLGLAWAVNFRGHIDRHRYPWVLGVVDQPEKGLEALKKSATHIGMPMDEMFAPGLTDMDIVPMSMPYIEDYNTVAYALGLCDRPIILNAMSIDTMSGFYHAATGIEVTPKEMLRAGRRIWNLEKAWLSMQGQSRKDDGLPERAYHETYETFGGSYEPMKREVYETLLTKYYESEGWDSQTGVPHPETLESLDLHEPAARIRELVGR